MRAGLGLWELAEGLARLSVMSAAFNVEERAPAPTSAESNPDRRVFVLEAGVRRLRVNRPQTQVEGNGRRACGMLGNELW